MTTGGTTPSAINNNGGYHPPIEPFGAYGAADFVGDNLAPYTRPFGYKDAQVGGPMTAGIPGMPRGTSPAGPGGLQSSKTTPGITCNAWRTCFDCVHFSFCMWNDEGQSCRQEIDVLFSQVHGKYFKTVSC